jgi:hypothetical protein
LDTNAQHLAAISDTEPAELIFSAPSFARTTPARRRNGHTSVSNASYLNTRSAFFAKSHCGNACESVSGSSGCFAWHDS